MARKHRIIKINKGDWHPGSFFAEYKDFLFWHSYKESSGLIRTFGTLDECQQFLRSEIKKTSRIPGEQFSVVWQDKIFGRKYRIFKHYDADAGTDFYIPVRQVWWFMWNTFISDDYDVDVCREIKTFTNLDACIAWIKDEARPVSEVCWHD